MLRDKLRGAESPPPLGESIYFETGNQPCGLGSVPIAKPWIRSYPAQVSGRCVPVHVDYASHDASRVAHTAASLVSKQHELPRVVYFCTKHVLWHASSFISPRVFCRRQLLALVDVFSESLFFECFGPRIHFPTDASSQKMQISTRIFSWTRFCFCWLYEGSQLNDNQMGTVSHFLGQFPCSLTQCRKAFQRFICPLFWAY